MPTSLSLSLSLSTPTHSACSHSWHSPVCGSILGSPPGCAGTVAGGETADPSPVPAGAPPPPLLPVGQHSLQGG